MQFSETVLPCTQLEVFSNGLKSMKVNFSIFPGQHNEPICSVLETSVRNRFPPPTSLKQLEDDLKEE
jgi:hypothetical protein